MDPTIQAFLVLGAFGFAFYIITRWWFWCLSFLIAGLVACFAMIASIVHFQILTAVALYFAMAICWGIAKAIAEA